MSPHLPPDAMAPTLDGIHTMAFVAWPRPFTDAAWNFELVPDGYRLLAQCGGVDAGARPRLHSRGHIDISERFPEVAEALAAWRLPGTRHSVVDGVVCALDAGGRCEPQRLYRRGTCVQRDPADGDLVYCVFDIVVADGVDTRALPWWQRRALLESLPWGDEGADADAGRRTPRRQSGTLRLQGSIKAEGGWMYRQATALGRSGMAAKRRDAAYRNGLSNDWRWISCASGATP